MTPKPLFDPSIPVLTEIFNDTPEVEPAAQAAAAPPAANAAAADTSPALQMAPHWDADPASIGRPAAAPTPAQPSVGHTLTPADQDRLVQQLADRVLVQLEARLRADLEQRLRSAVNDTLDGFSAGLAPAIEAMLRDALNSRGGPDDH